MKIQQLLRRVNPSVHMLNGGTNGFTRWSKYFCIMCLMLLLNIGAYSQVNSVKVMTFNIRYDNPEDGINRWDNRKELVTSTLFSISPDIFGMQEVLKRQLDYLWDNLPGYRSVGVGRDDGKTAGEYVPIFYKYDRFTLLDQGTFWLSTIPLDTGSVGWDAALTRICTWGKFLDKTSGLKFYFLNTHFDHMGDTARSESAWLILDFIKRETNGLPVILTGDFNSSIEDKPYSVLTDPEEGLSDVCQSGNFSKSCNEGTFNGFGSEKNPDRIDMVFYKGRWEVNSYEVLKIKDGEMFISDHWPVVVTLKGQQSAVSGQQSAVSGQRSVFAGPGDTTIVQTFTFDSIVTRRAIFSFPEKGPRYEKILMYYTLKCDSLTPHDKYPCGEWDYTTYTRLYQRTGKIDSVKKTQASFVVKERSPRMYFYSDKPTYTCYESYPGEGKQGNREAGGHGGVGIDYYARFEGADYISVPGEAFKNLKDEITVAFWLNGDPYHQPMASTIFEGLDAQGKRVINLHVPYDNGVVYWDAGGHGEGLTDNINKAASPGDYKGRWTHWTVTKNAGTGEQKIYVNGKLFQKGVELKRTMEGISTFLIGSNGTGSGRFYQGSIDDFAVWQRELDSLEILALPEMNPHSLPKENLLFCFNFDDVSKIPVIPDISRNEYHGTSFGNPAFPGFGMMPYADSKPLPGSIPLRDSIMNPLVSIVRYSDSLQPGKATDTLLAWPGYRYFCNSQGVIIDSVLVEGADTLHRRTWTYYSEPFEITESFEIARFITPYGKRLDLGLNGFTWIYDVTDYEPLLHGQVDLQAANGQELLDLKFLFIEGVPPRDVISVRNIWPEGSYTYKDLADDQELKAVMVKLDDKAETFRIRARLSGHGEYGPRACCEWDPKEHYIFINGEKKFAWKIWRDCGMNPVYPQGGTWQFDRAGWCPGTFVDTYDFELTPFGRPGERMLIDYRIEPYNSDIGEEGGNFETALQLFEYSAPNYHLDLELNDILSPSTRQEFRRMNPISLNPVIRVRNTGSDTILQFTVQYGLEGGRNNLYEWTGKLGFMQSVDIILPKPSWKGMTGESIFEALITEVNKTKYGHEGNNSLSSSITNPIILPAEFYLHVKTQGFGRAADNAYKITDNNGEVVYARALFADDSTYHDLIRLKPGAYDFTFTDKNEDGMIRHWWMYWEDKEKVGENGELKILDTEMNEIMNLGYDFAEKRTLQFFVGEPH